MLAASYIANYYINAKEFYTEYLSIGNITKYASYLLQVNGLHMIETNQLASYCKFYTI